MRLIDQEEKENLIELFKDIQSWILENDYECGPVGSDIYDRINQSLVNLGERNL